MFVLLFAALKVAGQTTGYLRFDTVRIMKQNGTCELYIINKTKDSLGLLTNVGGGLTQFRRSKMLNDSVLIIGLDTLTIHGAGSTTTASNGLTKVGNDIQLGGILTHDTKISGGASGYPFRIDSTVSISLFSGLEYVSSGIGSFIQMSDSVMSIGSSSATDFTSFVFSPTRIKFTAADGAGSSGDVWTNTGSGYGHWAAGSSGGSSTFSGLTDVTVSSPKNGQAPVYDSITSKWKNRTPVYYNVKDYGAAGDSTTDDRAAIIKARNAAYNGGGVLFFPAGKYRISDSILFNHSIRIQGVTKSGGLHNNQSSGTLEKDRLGPVETSTEIVVTDGKNGFVFERQPTTEIKAVLQVENLTMSSTVAPGSTTGGAFILVRGMIQDVMITGCTFYGGYIQVDIESGYYETVAYNHFSAPKVAGLRVGNNIRTDTGDFLVLGNVFNSGTFNTASDSTRAVWWHSGGGMKFIGNKIDACEFNTAHAFVYSIYVANIIDPTSDIIISNNSIENWSISAIYMRGIVSPYVRNIHITGNQFAPVSSTGPAIDIDHMETVLITDFEMRDWGGTVSNPAIKVTNSDGVVIGKGHIRTYTSTIDVTGSTDVHIDYMWGKDLGIGSNTTNVAGLNTSLYTTLTVKGQATSGTDGAGILELTEKTPDANGKDLGYINFVAATNAVVKRAVIIGGVTQGTTATDRGGKLIIYTKADGGSIAERFSINNAGKTAIQIMDSVGTQTGGCVFRDAISKELRIGPCGGGGSTSPGGSTTQFQFNNSSSFDGTSGMVWDNTNGRIGLGKTGPTVRLDIETASAGSDGIFVKNTSSGAAARPVVRLVNDASELGQFGMMSSTHATLPNYTLFEATKSIQFGVDAGVSSGGTSVINFVTGGYSVSPALVIKANGQTAVTDDAYNATTWNGNNEVPTKNAVRDKIESLGGSITSVNSMTGPAITITAGTGITTSSGSNDVSVAVDVNSGSLPHTIDKQFIDANNTGTGETDLYTKSIAGNTLNSNGQSLSFEVAGVFNDATATDNLQIYFAGTAFGGTGALTISGTGAWRAQGTVIRVSSSVYRANVTFIVDNTTQKVFTSMANVTSVDFTTSNTFKITGTAGGAGGGSNDITAQMWKITYQP